MSNNNLKESINKLKAIVEDYESDIIQKFGEGIDPLQGLIKLWSDLKDNQFINLFSGCIDDGNLKKICGILEDIYNWKIIDNQYVPEYGIEYDNTMDLALKDLVQFLNENEKMDICTGFFRPSVWELIGDSFREIGGLRLLIGNEYEIPQDTTERIQGVVQDLLEKRDDIDEHKEKSKIIHKEIIEGTSIDDFNLTEVILDLLKFLKRDSVKVRLQSSPFQHGKLYSTNKLAYLGSSNFTKSGLTSNRELNVQIQDKKLIKRLKKWYNQQFEQGTPYKEDLIDLIERSKFGNYPYTPFEVYMKIAFEQYKRDFLKIIEEGRIELAQFQAEGASKALGIVKQFGGVLIADAVGLGKSFTAMAVMDNLKFFRGLVICPAQLRDKWERYMYNFPACRVYSMEELSRSIPRKAGVPEDFDLILIDESHNFRNTNTNRYNNLLTLLEHSSNPRIILLTATPINTGLEDLLNQLLLISGMGKGFPSIGIPNLKDYFKQIESGKADIDLLKQKLMVAHSRAMIRYRQKKHHIDIMLPNNVMIEFPDRELKTVHYSLIPMSEHELNQYNQELEEWRSEITRIRDEYDGQIVPQEEKDRLQQSRPRSPSEEFYEHIFDTLDSLKLAPFNLELYKDEEYQEKEILQRNRGITAMLRTMLLKRMESSLISFMESIETQIKLCYIFENLLEKNYVATSQFIDKLEDYIEKISEDDDEVQVESDLFSFDKLEQFAEKITPEKLEEMRTKQLTEEELAERDEDDKYFNYLKKINPEEFIEDYQEKMISDVRHDQEKFEELLSQTKEILEKGDFKLEELKSTLTSLLEEAQKENERKIVIFSYFRTTADYIYEDLKNDQNWNEKNKNIIIKKITGDTPSAKRIDYVEKFAPHSCLLELQGPAKVNKQKELADKEKINILISTDVLSEGQNLQDGRYVINYDLHWNPVRMIQRSGRIDRLGALHDKVGILNFFPQTGLERLIHLVERLRRRLSTIDDALGLDADTLDAGDAKKKRRLLEERKKREQEKQIRDEIQRIEKEDENIIEEFEERMEFGGTDLAKIKLFSEIKRQGYEYYRNEVPLGIHSGLVNVSYSGYIVVVSIKNQDVEQLKWMFWSEDEKFRKNLEHHYGLLIDKPKVERMLDNVVSEWEEIKNARYEEEPRILIEEPQELFRKVIHIIRRFKRAQKKEDKLANLKNKKPIQGNGIYHRFLNKAIQRGLIKKAFAEKFQQLLLQKSINVLAKEEEVAEIVEKFNKTRDEINKLKKEPKIDELDKEEIINELYEKGARELLGSFYEYMEKTGLKVKEKKKSRIENENLKLVGFIRVYKLDDDIESKK